MRGLRRKKRDYPPFRWESLEPLAINSLAMGFTLFMIGFVVIAGEWFYLWDSLLQSMHAKAILFSLLLASFAYFVSQVDDRKLTGENSYGPNLDHFSTKLHHN